MAGKSLRAGLMAIVLAVMSAPAFAVAPTANPGPNQNVNEQTGVTLNGSASSDSDGTIATFAWSQTAGTPVTLVNAGSAVASFTAPIRLVPQGSVILTFQLTVTDNDAETNSATVNVTVNPVNALPVAEAGPNQTVNETSPVTLNGSASSDPDGSISAYAWSQTAGTTVTLTGANTAGPTFTSPTLPGNSSALLTFTLEVTDNEGAKDTDTVNITVDQVNVAPVISGQVPISIPEDTSLEIVFTHLTVTDPDNTYPTGFTLSVQNGTNYTRSGATITPVLNFSGVLTVPVSVNDGTANSNVFNLSVTVTPVNDPPVITGQSPLSVQEDQALTILLSNIVVSDPDIPANTLTLFIQDGANYTRSNNTVTPIANFSGNLTVGAIVSDGVLNSNTFNLSVSVGAEPDSPTLIMPIAAQNAVEMSPFNLNVSGNFADADGDKLTFTATGLPPSGNITLNSQTGAFSGTPRLEDAQPTSVYNITVTARDPGGLFATGSYTLTISSLDRANISLTITAAPSPAMLNDELRWTFNASNAVGPQAGVNVVVDGSFFGRGLTVTTASSCTIQSAGSQVTNFSCSIGNLPVGGTTTVILDTATSQAGDVTAFATAAGAASVPIDPNPDDNSDQLAVGVAESFSNGAVQILGNAIVQSMAAGDLNNDGANDLVVGTGAGQPVQVYLSSGFRAFSGAAITLPGTMSNTGVALADFDNNGTLDIVVANGGGDTDMVYSNGGSANFSVMATLGLTFSQDVAVGDFDGDNNMDIAFATIAGNPVYLGNGSGGFTLHTTLGNANSRAVAAGFLNNDDREDLVFANVGSDSRVWTKNSGAGFTSRDLLNIGDATSVALADLGGNGRDDALFGRISSAVGDIPSNPILINDGTGNFGNPTERLGNSPTNDVLIGDVDDDGMLDLVFLNDSGVHQIWNATGGGYALHSEQIVASAAIRGVLTDLGMADVGDPGGVDLALGGASQSGAAVFLNDSFGNLGRGDAVAPVLTLLGANPFEVPSNTTYVDPGASALDNIDGIISGSIVITNPVVTSVIGAYTVTYNVTDFAGNPATPVTRIVNVVPSSGSGGGGGGGAVGAWMLLLLGGTLLAGVLFRRNAALIAIRTDKIKKGTRK